MIDGVLLVASDGVSWVSSWAIVMLVWLAALSLATASCAKCSWYWPSCATGPVNGPSMAIDAVHFLAPPPLPLDEALAALLELLELLLPQPAAISPANAAATRNIRPFIAVAPSSGVAAGYRPSQRASRLGSRRRPANRPA